VVAPAASALASPIECLAVLCGAAWWPFLSAGGVVWMATSAYNRGGVSGCASVPVWVVSARSVWVEVLHIGFWSLSAPSLNLSAASFMLVPARPCRIPNRHSVAPSAVPASGNTICHNLPHYSSGPILSECALPLRTLCGSAPPDRRPLRRAPLPPLPSPGLPRPVVGPLVVSY